MGQDGNTIEIEIDAAATVAAAKTAGEANAKLVKFDQALGLFRDNVGLVSKTTEDVATRMGDFNTILGKFADSLVTNLADMQTSVVQKIEPHLERELENMVNRVLNKVEAKTGTTGESRSRSEAKQGAAAPAVPVTPAGQRVGVSQDTDYKKPDYRIKENIVERIVSDLDEATGKQVERILTTRNTRVIKDDHDQYEDEEGNLVDKTSTITTFTSEVNKANKVIAEGAKVEKDRGIAIRKEITGALIGLHVMKVVSQYSQVFNAGFMLIAAAMGHLLNNLLLPMMPMFTQIAQVIHMIANVVTMLPMPIRQLLGAFVMFKAASMLAASMPFKDIKDGFGGIKSAMESSATGIQKFIKLLAGFVDFMMSGQGRGAVSWIGGGLGKVGGAIAGGAKKLLGKRAGGGPVLGHGAYIVGEKGPEIFVPKTSGSIIPNHKIGRADGVGDVAAAPTGSQAPILPDIGSTLLGGAMGAGLGYMFTGSPLVAAGGGILGAAAGASGADIIGTIAGGVGAMMSNDTVQGIMGGMHLLTNTLAAFLAPIAPMLGVIAGVVGVASGVRSGLGGGDGGKTAETVATVGKAQLKQTAAMSYGVQNTVNAGTRGTSSSLMALLLRMNGCIKVAPCTPDAFGIIAAITTALPAAITLALAAATGLITYKLITEGIMPPLALAGVISYAIKTEGVVPEAVSKSATITYNIVKNGVEPIANPISTAITYTIKTIGEIPVTIGKAVDLVYNIVTKGTEPIVKSATAYIEYVIKTTGTVPTLENVVAHIEAKFGPIPETELAKLKAAIEAAFKADPAKIAVTNGGGAEEVVEKANEEIKKASKANPAKIAVTNGGGAEEVVEKANEEIKKASKAKPAKIALTTGGGANEIVDKVNEEIKAASKAKPAEVSINVPKGIDLEVNPTVDEAFLRTELERVWANIDATRKLLMQAEFPSDTYTKLQKQIDDMVFDAKEIELRIEALKPATIPTVSLKANIIDLITTEVGDKLVDVKGNVWDVTAKAGETLTLKGINGEIASVTYDPNRANVKEIKIWEAKVEKLTPTESSITTMRDIIAKRMATGDGVKVPVKLPVTVEPELPGGYSLKSLFEKASRAGLGEILGLGVVLAIDEYARTGTVKLVDLLVGLGLGTLTFAGAEAVLTSVAGSLGGAAAAGAVGFAFGAIGVTLSGLIAGGVATSFLQDLNTGMQESIDSGGATVDFGNFILNAAASLGSDFNTYLSENLNIDIPEEAFRLAGIGMNAAGQLIMNPSSEWPRILGDFINDLKTTVAGGIPVDVKIDVDSVTSVVQQIGEASNLGGYTGPVVSDPGVGGGQPPINDPVQIGGNDPMGPYAPPVEPPVAYDPNNPEGLPTWVDPNPPPQCPEGQYFDSSLGTCVGGYYAAGGNVAPRIPVMVGEKGPELFIPDTSPTSIGGGGGSTNVTNHFTFNVTTNNPRELTDTVMKELKMELARVKM